MPAAAPGLLAPRRGDHHADVTVPRGISLGRRWLAWLVASLAVAAYGESTDASWFVRVWKTSEQLAGDYVSRVVQSGDGFLWVVAGGQLHRFDGVTLERFPLEPATGGTERRIRDFVPLREGGFAFVLYDGAIVTTKGGRERTLTTALPHLRAEMLFEDRDSLLVVFSDASVWRVRSGAVTNLTDRDGLPAHGHSRFIVDHGGQVWFSKGDDVGIERGDRFETLFHIAGAPHLAAARDGGVWIGAENRLLHVRHGEAPREIAALPLAHVPVRPNMLLEDRTGAVWFGTYDRGLFRFDGKRFESVPVSHRQITWLTEDNEGSIWAGTSGGGFDQIQPRAMAIEGGEAGLPSEAVLGLAEDAAGTLWGYTQSGSVVVRHARAWHPADGALGALDTAIAIAASDDGALWVCGRDDTLHRWRDGRLTTWTHADGINGSGDRRMLVTRDGSVWLASSRPANLQVWRNGAVSTVTLPWSASLIRALVEDVTGNVWAALNGHRLLRITPAGKLVDESKRIASVDRPIRVLLPTPDGTLWIGYDQGGIGRLTPRGFAQITTRNGLTDDNIEVILADHRGWLWLASRIAIFKVSEREIADVAEGRTRRVQSVQYGEEQGVQPTFGEQIGALCRRDGRLWIPMATSLAIIDPAQERSSADAAPVCVTAVRVDDKWVAQYGIAAAPRTIAAPAAELSLAPDHRRIDIDYTALSFRTPLNVHFRYRLEGFDDAWVEAGTRRSASYSRLVAGDYRFRVRACNSDGVWNDVGALVAFRVEPFVWQTWWFRLLAISVFTALVFGVARFVANRRLRQRLRVAEQEAAIERERARIARDIHDDLGSRLTKIVLLSGLAERDRGDPAKAGPRVQEISDTARQVLKSLDETVWAVNPRNDTLPHLVSYIGQFAVNFLRTAEIACELELPEDPPDLPLSADVRHHVFLCVKEALTNVVRHAQATMVILRVVVGDTQLELTVADNGRGMAGAVDAPEADGLGNMRQRMGQVGGAVRVASTPGGGTTVTFTLPRQRTADR